MVNSMEKYHVVVNRLNCESGYTHSTKSVITPTLLSHLNFDVSVAN